MDILQQGDINLVISDINLPGGTFFSLLEKEKIKIENIPYIIFATAHDQYAVKAFNLGAVDYIVKPVLPGRFKQALLRYTSYQNKITTYLSFSNGSTTIRVPQYEIIYISANGKKSIIHTIDKELESSRSISELEAILEQDNFYRFHRKHLGNKHFFHGIKHKTNGQYQLILSDFDNTTLPVGRKYLANVKSIFKY